MGADYIEPTASGRIRILTKISAVVLILGVSSFGLRVYEHALPRCDAIKWIRGEVIAVIFIWLCFTLLVARNGWRAVRAGRWPADGADVFFRQKVLRGWRVWLVPVDAIGLLALCVYSVAIFGPLFMSLLDRAANGCNA
jgi:hypothetical protein